MKDFDNYECEGQMELFDIYLKSCCGVIPWLYKTKCCRWDESKPQKWLMYYICPKCYKRPVDSTKWGIHSYGTFEEAKENARQVWNDPQTEFEVCEVIKEFGFHLSISENEPEEWEKLYGVSLEGKFTARLTEEGE